MQFYNCLAIEPNPKNRIILKHAMSLVTQFNNVKLVRNERVALELLRGNADFDLIFISDKFDKNRIVEFIKKAKETEFGAMAGYVLLTSKLNDAGTVAKTLLNGIDGVLIEPYSIDSLQELSLLAAKVRTQKEEEKRKNVLSFLTSNVIYCVDIMAQAMLLEHKIVSTKKMITKVNEFITTSDDNCLLEPYLDILSKAFMKIEKPIVIVQKDRYKGSSERVKRIAKMEVIDQLEDKICALEKNIKEKNIL